MCIAKDFIRTTLKMIFSIFRFYLHPQILDILIFISHPNIVQTKHTSMERLFIQISDDV